MSHRREIYTAHSARREVALSGPNRSALAALARLIQENVTFPGTADDLARDNSPGTEGGRDWAGIPSGYAYLFQLAAHDMVHTAAEIGQRTPMPGNVQSFRKIPLEMETVLGGGPRVCPHIYDRFGETGGQLRLGRTRKGASRTPPWTGEKGDLARFIFADDGRKHSRDRAPDVLIADQRNDDNLLLSQITALFHHIFNRLYTAAVAINVDEPWLLAAQAFARTWRRVLRDDFMPRVLHPDVLAHYRSNPGEGGWLANSGEVPAAFTFGVGRLGHCMIRESYVLNRGAEDVETRDLLNVSSDNERAPVPIPEDWLIDWRRFFPTATSNPALANWSRRFGPHVEPSMASEEAVKPPSDPGRAEDEPPGVVFRDLLRGAAHGLHDVPGILAKIAGAPNGVGAISSIKSILDTATRKKLVEDGLQALLDSAPSAGTLGITTAHLDAIRAEPPLLLVLMFEAQLHGNGRTIGPVGSVILAEAMHKVLARQSPVVEDDVDHVINQAFGRVVRDMPSIVGAMKVNQI